MIKYLDLYKKRLTKWGNTYQEIVQNQREHAFDMFLQQTVYQVEFEFNNEIITGSLERMRQNETKILQYLKVKRNVEIPNGTIIKTKNTESQEIETWMLYYEDIITASGYNKYVVLKMTNYITWKDADKQQHSSWAYLYGQENNMLKDELKSRSRSTFVYNENLKLSFFIMPKTPYLQKDFYIEIGENEYKEAYVVTGYDRHSTPGVMYVSIDPTYIRNKEPIPPVTPGDENKYFWLEGDETWKD